MRFTRSVGAVALLVAAAAQAQALVGPADEGGPLESHAVMVLKRAPSGAGFCSGVVVARNVVLTAAHCVAKLDDTRVHLHEVAGRPMLWPVSAIAVHPLYRANAIKTRERSIDLALVRTADPLPDRLSPVRLSSLAAMTSGLRLRIAGFGVAREGRAETSGVLRAGTLVVRDPISSLILWAEDPMKKGVGACTGDSGGPIFDESGATLIAITDWSAGDGRGSTCGRLTQGALIAPQRGWIEGVLASWGVR
jgi:secreted trypsin-like serine protease